MARRNGRSYVQWGETPKRYWEPSQGDVIYLGPFKTKLGKPHRDPDTGHMMFPLHPPVEGTIAMGAQNIKMVARVEEGKGVESVGSVARFSYRPNPRQRKTRDLWVVQGNYGYGHGWEDLTAEETYKEARQRLKEYNENERGVSHRLKLTREKIEANPSSGPDRGALLDTLKHLNWVFGKGEIQSMEWTPGSSTGGARVKLQYGGQFVKFTIDSTGKYVTFRGHRRKIAYQNPHVSPSKGLWTVRTWQGDTGQFSTRKAAEQYCTQRRQADRRAGNKVDARVVRVSNPSRSAGPSAIPTHWVKAKVNRVGGQIQIRMGGGR